MKIFDKLFNMHFETNNEGKRIYYPYGLFGQGYYVNEDDEKRARNFLKNTWKTVILFYILIGITTVFAIHFRLSSSPFLIIMLSLLLIYLAVYFIGIANHVKKLPSIKTKLTLKEKLLKISKRSPIAGWFFEIVFCTYFIFKLSKQIISGHIPIIWGAIFFIVFLALIVFSFYMIIMKIIIKKNNA